MSISFGGLGIMSLRKPFAELVGMVLGKGDIRSMFCLVVFCIVFLVLAYLTNPSENSFRAYLTEQSFRQHLSRLDDAIDDDQDTQERSDLSKPYRNGVSSNRHTLSFDNRSPFHFANRASVSLRTPKHVFHSFGIFTIAAMIPLAKTSRTARHRHESDGSMISDSWFIGAFGKWWRGGILETWYQDVIARSTDEESWSSGILGMKTLDDCTVLPGLPFSTKNLPSHALSRGSPPRLRNRERPSQRSGMLSARSSTPPPLPKSVSLPLHTTRPPQMNGDRNHHQSPPLSRSPSQISLATDPTTHLTSPLAPSPSTLFDQSPRVAELLRQITFSTTNVLELRTQLTDGQSVASQSHSSLQGELDSCRDRKRQEDVARSELKLRTRNLDESKRSAEALKREAEKRLRAAQTARDDATQRMEHIDQEISELQQRLHDDEASVHGIQEGVSDDEQDIADALNHKRREIKVAEDVITALNLRARELEERISSAKEKLHLVQVQAENRKQDHISQPVLPTPPWTPLTYSPFDSSNSITPTELTEPSDVFPASTNHNAPTSLPVSPKPAHLALGGISNFNGYSSVNQSPVLRHSGHVAAFDKNLLNLGSLSQFTSKFSPFADSPVTPSPPVLLSPSSDSLIPTGLMSSLDNADSMSRSFQSDSDMYMDRDWRNRNGHGGSDSRSPGLAPMSSSPTSICGPSVNDRDPFEVRVLTSGERGRYPVTSDSLMDMQRVSLQRKNTDPLVHTPSSEEFDSSPANADQSSLRRWFSTSSRDSARKRLNPDAKVFNVPRGPISSSGSMVGIGNGSAYDALNPNGMGSGGLGGAASSNNLLLRAFAPSPAEREALKRALGGSTNNSLERLPSLSDVGSIPPSPSHVHAHAHAHADTNNIPQRREREVGRSIPSWLQTLPRIRKPNFSPWDDEEPANGAAGVGK